jgi:hypothetical protein
MDALNIDATNMDTMDAMNEFEPPRFSFHVGEAERPTNNFRLSLDRDDNHD